MNPATGTPAQAAALPGSPPMHQPQPLRFFHLTPEQSQEFTELPQALPQRGFIWLAFARPAFDAQQAAVVQAALQRWGERPLVDLHVADLQNAQLPSSFDATSWYDLLVFRRLAAGAGAGTAVMPSDGTQPTLSEQELASLRSIDTSPVGFAVFDHVLITVHPPDCPIRDRFAQRLEQHQSSDPRSANRIPASAADMMLRMVNHMVDGYLDLRRQLSRQLGDLQQRLLDPKARFHDWPLLLNARTQLHHLEEVCEDQHAAVQEWIDALDDLPTAENAQQAHERELLRVRSRDVLEHIRRVLSHVNRLEQSSETAVQMHFSALGHRTNAIMRTLTVLTAVFLPLNFITGFFGMNFDALPLIHHRKGVWIAVAAMALVGLGLIVLFWRKRFLTDSAR